jgi:lactoylglutathione lyase
MKFLWTTIHVNNMDESLNFYKDVVGLKLKERFISNPGMEIAFLGDEETKIELICNKNLKSTMDAGKAISLGFKVDSVDDKIEFIKKIGIDIKSGPIQPNPSIKYFFVLDPNGVKIQFVEQFE